jgi:WD40 repeat protein/serine/threonine protein kinase
MNDQPNRRMTKFNERVEAVFQAALALQTEAERAEYLNRACPEPELRAEVESLLVAHAHPESILEDKTIRVEMPPAEGPGTQIGKFKILEQIGAGGFGVVYMAEQKEPVRRRVALKIIKLGMDTKQVVARFEAERQALALMDHANVARVLEGGCTETGRPYFVMELVKGRPITKFCDEERLSTVQRLDLFITVCRAVQHAHQKGLVHRDLKPSNVLVSFSDGKPMPKIIDFGIAKAMQHDLTDKTVFTRFQQFMGTPAYMSPEQAGTDSADIDTRSDIYSLGVLLYELLTGRTPMDAHELAKADYDEIRRQIREVEPMRPSNRISTLAAPERTSVAQSRSVDPAKLSRLVRGDLDWIVLKAMDKDRNRRYETANEFAKDLQRYLDNEPVTARKPNLGYVFHKFARRHKVGLAFAACLALLLIVSAGVAAAQAIKNKSLFTTAEEARLKAMDAQQRETELRRIAEEERGKAEAERDHSERLLYTANMNLASYALHDSNIGRTQELLKRHIPKAGEPDLRGWEWRYLWRQCRSDELATLGSHDRSVMRVAFSPDGTLLASSSVDRTVKIWDVTTRKELRTLPHDNTVNGLAFSPNGKLLATGDEGPEGLIRFWDTATWKVEKTITNGSGFRPVVFSPDGKLVAVTADMFVNVWNVETGKQTAHIKCWHRGIRQGLAFSPDGKWLAYLDRRDGQIKLWNPQTQSVRVGLSAGIVTCEALGFSPSGRHLVAGTKQGNTEGITVWNLAGLDKQLETADAAQPLVVTNYLTLTNHATWIGSICFSADGKVMMTSSGDQKIKFWDTATWRETASLKGHEDAIQDLALSPDGQLLASGSSDKTVRLWSTQRMSSEPDYRSNPEAGPFLKAASLRAVPCWSEKRDRFQVWDPMTGETSSLGSLPEPNAWPRAISPDGRLAALAVVRSNRIHLAIWNINEQKTTAHLGEVNIDSSGVWHDPRLGVADVVFSANNRWLAVREDTGIVRFWDVEQGQQLAELSRPGDKIMSWCLAADSSRLVTGHFSGLVCVWELPSGTLLQTLTGQQKMVYDIALSPDGRTVATTSGFGRVQVWNLDRQAIVAELSGALLGFRLVAFSPDSRRLAACAGEGDIKVWELANHQEVATLRGHKEWHERLGFTADGNTLISMGYESVHLWRAASLNELNDSHPVLNR